MSQTTTRPRSDAVTQRWHEAMKEAFGAGGGPGGGGGGAPAVGRMTRDRLGTLRKTFETVRGQSPEVALRPLQDIASALAVEETLATDAGERVPPAGQEFKRQVMAEIDNCKARAIETSQAHVAAWQRKIDTLPAEGVTAESRAARGKAIQGLLAEIEPGVARDSYMLNRVDPKAAAGALDALDVITATANSLKDMYKALRPAPDPRAGAPGRLPEVARPAIGGRLTDQEQKDLAGSMKETQATMGADGKTDPAKVKQAVALIAKGIDVEDREDGGTRVEGARSAMIRLKTWDAVKGEYRAMLKAGRGDEAKAFMARMWWFRRMTVDGEMTKLQEKYDFTWGSVGSDNPESDYDLTVRDHPAKPTKEVKWDYQVVELANKALTAPFGGAPPGIVFDTNLYAEAAPKEMSDEQKRDPATKAMGAMKEQGQDVGALMKLRRFMEWDEYEDYKAAMLADIADPEDKALVQRQFDEADSLFLIARAEQLREAAGQMPEGEARRAQEAKIAALQNSPDGQRELLAMAADLEHHAADSMAANNALYAKKLTAVRDLEAEYDAATDAQAKAGLLARLKSLQADATFFAAEAYHSEGPLQHVVKAGQSSRLAVEGNGVDYGDDKKAKNDAINAMKAEKLKALSANQMLQSFNENLGDLLKDLRHYAGEPFPGLGFYRSSKYIERLCDAAAIIAPKLPEDIRRKFTALEFGGKPPATVQGLVANLVDIRGEKTGFTPPADGGFDPEAEKQAYAVEQMKAIFPGVVTLPDLAKEASAFGQKVNALVRSAITKEMRAAEENPYFPKNGKA